MLPCFATCLKVFAQYVNCTAANPGADAGMYDASEQYKLKSQQIFICDKIAYVGA